MFKLTDGRDELFQWDVNRTLTVEPEITQVHFANVNSAETLDVDVLDGQVLIPNELLQTDWDLYCYAYDTNFTKYEATFKVNKRQKPSGYAFTPTEVHAWKELEEKKLDKGGHAANKFLGTDESGNVITKDASANDIAFEDGETFQQKFNSGQLKGEKGEQGLQGPKGLDGAAGPKGDKGDTGLTGPQGPEGKQGPAGKDGANGKDGAQGLQGEAGPQGLKGDKGDTYTITESDYSAIADVVLTKLPNAEGVKY